LRALLRHASVFPALLSIWLLPTAAPAQEEPLAPAPAASVVIGIEYTIKLEDGTTVDSNVGGEPMLYSPGGGMILPALEDALKGLEKGESKQVTLSPEQAYGDVRPELEREIPTDKIPEDGRHAGALLMSEGPDGQTALVRVKEVKDDVILLDLNHPLAGQALTFDVKVLSIE
jgi:FKBP-type peptidyl-prolyl cis-trans isomerase 2